MDNNIEESDNLEEENLPNQIIHEPRYWAITFLAVILTVIVVGGGVWWFMNKKVQTVDNALIERIEQLELQIANQNQNDSILGNTEISVSGLNTYKNEVYGLQIEIPKLWEVLVNSKNDTSRYNISFRDKKFDGSSEWPGLSIAYESEPEGLSGARRFSFNQELNEVSTIYFSEGKNHIKASCKFYLLSEEEKNEMLETCNETIQTLTFVAGDEVSAEGEKMYNGSFFSFEYPSEWLKPELKNVDDIEVLDYTSNETQILDWEMKIGPIIKGACGGDDCYNYDMRGFIVDDVDSYITSVLENIKNYEKNFMVLLSDNTSSDGTRKISYTSPGICGYKDAFIVKADNMVKMNGRCAADSESRGVIFDRILSTFKFK